MTKRNHLKVLAGTAALAFGLMAAPVAFAQQKLKWAHVYETSEHITPSPYGRQKKLRNAATVNLISKFSQPLP